MPPESWQHAAHTILSGGIAVIPTDTLYGVLVSALNPATVERIYRLRERDAHKPLITLISDVTELKRFGIDPNEAARVLLERAWPGPVTVILPCIDPALAYLHRGSGGMSFRLPAKPQLRGLLRQTGPLVAPSANPQGSEPALTVAEARQYFGRRVDYYLDEGQLQGAPSALVSLLGDEPRVLRPAPGFRL